MSHIPARRIVCLRNQSKVLEMVCNYNSVAVIGGDKRQLFAADAFLKRGFEVALAGFDKLESRGGLRLCTVGEALGGSDIVLLPVQGLSDGKIKCYFSDKEIYVDSSFVESVGDKPVFMGRAKTFPGVKAHDLLLREDFAVLNALPSAEGAVETAMREYEGTISGSRCLVIGYGRIGSVLSRLLSALGARTCVCSRSETGRAKVVCDGNTPYDTSELSRLSGFDIVFNTADAVVLNEPVLSRWNSDTLIIDLASLPGGVDFAAANRLGFTTVQAPGLPGRCSPKTAGKILADTVLNILKEEYRCPRQV